MPAVWAATGSAPPGMTRIPSLRHATSVMTGAATRFLATPFSTAVKVDAARPTGDYPHSTVWDSGSPSRGDACLWLVNVLAGAGLPGCDVSVRSRTPRPEHRETREELSG
jgi:hypothetical protein